MRLPSSSRVFHHILNMFESLAINLINSRRGLGKAEAPL